MERSPRQILEPFFHGDDIRIPIRRIEAVLPPAARIYVIGGALRNRLIESVHGRTPKTGDIDIFIGSVDPDLSLRRIDLDGDLHPTELGGVRWRPAGARFAFDIGLLPRFVIIEKFGLPPTPRSLLSAIDFDVNAVLLDWQGREVMTAGCMEAIARKRIDFNTTLVADKLLLVYRIMLIHHRTGFILSKRVFDYLKEALDLATLNRLKAALSGKLGECTAEAVMAACDRLGRCRSHREQASCAGAEPDGRSGSRGP